MASTWETIATNAQQSVLDAIPAKWRLSAEHKDPSIEDKTSIPRKCGLLTPTQLAITESSATELVEKLRTRTLSSVEVVEAYCARAAIAHQLVNCLAGFFPEEALEKAKQYDETLAKTGKPVGPLHGLPIAVKDTYWIKGQRTTMGYISWYDNIATEDSTMARILRSAGAVFFARTTMPQTGMLLETWSPLFGRTLNPFNPKFGPGGSSGGDGALVALNGSPITPSSDIGGSIRAPAAFNGLYGMRPTADRVPKRGMTTAAPGNVSIKVSCGPNAHNMADVRLLASLILDHEAVPFEPSAAWTPWRKDVKIPESKSLRIGFWMSDRVVEPHPPIKRALLETKEKLRAAGHDVFNFNPDFDFWKAALCTWKLYFQTGAKEQLELMRQSGEPVHPTFLYYLKTFNIQELTIHDLFKANNDQAAFKYQFLTCWNAAASSHSMDVFICPAGPCAGIPHEFPIWWGYFSIFNLLDYPSIIMPIKDFKINGEQDPKDLKYQPKDNPFDRPSFEIYNPELWKTQPVCLQVVGMPYRDEELIAAADIIDSICNAE